MQMRGGAAAARVAHNLEVAGSNPAPATSYINNGGVAQWLEHGTHKAGVGGSNPFAATRQI